MMSYSGLAGHPLVLVSWWTTTLTSSCPALRCWSGVHGWVRRVRRGDCTAGLLFVWSKIIVCHINGGCSNESGWNSLMSLLKWRMWIHPCAKAGLGRLRVGQNSNMRNFEGEFSRMALDNRDFSMGEIYLEREAGKWGASLSDTFVTASLDDTRLLLWYLTQLDLPQLEWKLLWHFTLITVLLAIR